ncbi:cytochrome P450 [Whalleya microplaca]|nr:cytochrome P450 [Whalleya microplaca]
MNDNSSVGSSEIPGPGVVGDWKSRVTVDSTLVTPSRIVPFLFTLTLAYWISVAVYRMYFHPLAKYPGPKLAAMTNWAFNYNYLKGDIVPWQDELHKKYGEVVRLGPNRLSYITASALKEIMGHQTANHNSNPKNPQFNQPPPNGCDNLVTTRNDQYHGKMRRVLANAFSDRALREQEELILTYVDKLLALTRRYIAEDPEHRPAVNVVRLFNFTTFDIMGDLAFGESMGNLDSGKYASWVAAIMPAFYVLQIMGVVEPYAVPRFLFRTFMTSSMKKNLTKHWSESCESVSKRLAKGDSARPDIWGLVLKKGDEITRPELDSNSHLFMLAGTETTATSLSGQVYYLLRYPDKMEKLLQEVRSVADESELTVDRLRHMPYLQAVIDEALRIYPPVPIMAQRQTPPRGNTLDGQFVPGNTLIAPATWTAFRHPVNWKDGNDFIPERWILNDPDYAQYHEYDKREASQPFTTGPRACLGKNLAYYEMRAILSRLLYNFDLELCPESQDWINQKSWSLWDKPPLMVKISPRK